MRELLEFIVKSIVKNHDQISIREKVDEDGVITFDVSVCPEDMGKVIGRGGRVAKAIRSVMKAAAVHANKKVSVEIIEEEKRCVNE